MKKMRTSQNGIDFIKKFEGCVLKSYKPVPTEKYYTIGYGHYGIKDPNMKITQQRAEELLKEDLTQFENNIHKLGKNLTQECFDVLVSWQYNLGMGNFNSSTLRKKIIAEAADTEITDQIIKWVNSAGKPLLGLKRRRVAEANMWLGYELYKIDSNGNIYKAK